VEEGKSDKGEYYVKVPPDYEKLNLKAKDKLTISKDCVKTLEKLPVDWKINK
jgi:hypothetical protein